MAEAGRLSQPNGRPAGVAPAGPPLARWYLRVCGILAFVALDVVAVGALPLSERAEATGRSMVAPGLGLIQDERTIAVVFLVAAPVTVLAWLRWGLDWPVIAVWVGAAIATAWLFPGNHIHGIDDLPHVAGAPDMRRGAHEITWVMAVFALIYWVGLFLQRFPLVDRVVGLFQRARPPDMTAVLLLPPVERARAVAIWGIAREAGATVPAEALLRGALRRDDVRRRARRIGVLARARFRMDPLHRDNAHTRAALLLWNDAERDATENARSEAARSPLGMLASEPGWVRLLDGTLLAAALQIRCGPAAATHWPLTLDRWFRLSRRHRPSSRHTWLGIAPARAPAWEHATATAVALACGWIAPEAEWRALRRQVMGAVGRGGRSRADNRLAAAGRCWTAQVDDEEAQSLLRRVSSAPNDPIAQGLDALAQALRENPGALRSQPAVEVARSGNSTGTRDRETGGR